MAVALSNGAGSANGSADMYDHAKVAHFIGEPSPTSYRFLPFPVRAELSGANSLDVAPAGRVTDFVKSNGGHTVITKVRSLQEYPFSLITTDFARF